MAEPVETSSASEATPKPEESNGGKGAGKKGGLKAMVEGIARSFAAGKSTGYEGASVAQAPDPARPDLHRGVTVELFGLKTVELNGQRGVLETLSGETGRWRVIVDGQPKALKPDNLKVVEAASSSSQGVAASSSEPEVRETSAGVWEIGGSEPEEAGAPAASSDDPKPKAGGQTNGPGPKVMGLMFPGSVDKGPDAEGAVKDFKEHMEEPLRQMALLVAEKWKAAGAGASATSGISVESQVEHGSKNEQFAKAFPGGFAVECIQAVAGPPAPIILFKFRHVGKFSGSYTDAKGVEFAGSGQIVDLEGMCNAQLLPGQPVGTIELYYNPPKLIKAMSGEIEDANSNCPVSGKPGVCPMMG